MGVDDIAAGEDPFDIRRRTVIGEAFEQAAVRQSTPSHASAVRLKK